jgi:3D (Asp-Asp-Asp) domain-containing protein
MDNSVGSRVRVKFYNGKIVEAEKTAIVNESAGRKIRIFFESASAVINPEQIIEVLPTT